jgi:hypothetical protein
VQRVSDNAAGAVVELRPDVAVRRDGAQLFLVWQELCEGRDDDCGRIKLARFDPNGRKLGADLRVDTGADSAGKWNPALALDHGGNPLVAWVDERDRWPRGLPLEHIYFSRGPLLTSPVREDAHGGGTPSDEIRATEITLRLDQPRHRRS